MEWTPLPVADFLLLHLPALAWPLALLGALALTMLLGGIAGFLYGLIDRFPLAGFAAAGGFLAWFFLLLLAPGTVAPGGCFVAADLIVLVFLTANRPPNPSRREVLLRSGAVLGSAGLLLTLFSVRLLLDARPSRRLFLYRRPRGLALSGLTDLVTSQERFYVMDKVLEYPEIGPPNWHLRIDGAVGRALSLDVFELLRRPVKHRYITLECVDNPVGGPLMSTALWTGIPVADLLRESRAEGDFLLFHSADNYLETAPRREVEARNALVAYAMNGELLSSAHGYPARLLMPGLYGFKSVKWLTRIEVVRGERSGEWRSHGWTDVAVVQTTTRIDLARRAGEEILVAGIAFAGTRGIRAVQVRVNGGPWREATLVGRLSRDAWVQWVIRLRGAGTATIEARAVDGEGRVQTSRRHAAYPDGSTGWATLVM